MTLTTRCPHCATTFKVVPDQLKVSDGWVRCGRCQTVFDAAPHLSVLEPSGGASNQPDADAVEASTSASVPDHFHQTASEPSRVLDSLLSFEEQSTGSEWVVDLGDGPAGDVQDVESTAALPALQGDAQAAAEVVTDPRPEASQVERLAAAQSVLPQLERAAADSAVAGEAVSVHTMASAASPGAAGHPIEPVLDLSAPAVAASAPVASSAAFDVPVSAPDPAWARNEFAGFEPPRQRQRWPWVMGSLVLLVVLLGQLSLHARDALAAQHALLRPWLVTLCGMAGCEVRPLRQIDGLVIESSSFERIRSDVYQLSFVLRNRTALPLARPSVELTLTDRHDKAVARRVWSSQELTGAPGILPPGGEWSGQYPVKVAGERLGDDSQNSAGMSGYTVGIFYP